jgi:hypothetical protein
VQGPTQRALALAQERAAVAVVNTPPMQPQQLWRLTAHSGATGNVFADLSCDRSFSLVGG